MHSVNQATGRTPGTAAVVTAVSGVVPSRKVTNADLAARLDTTDEWIRTRTGIHSRYVVEPGGATSDLAVAAGRAVLTGDDRVDMLILATSTPDHPVPATAPLVAHRLGLGGIPAFDLNAVCTGFLYGLAMADSLIRSGTARRVLLIGADAYSSIVNPADRTTVAVFGDGAGAVTLRAGETDEPGALGGFDLGGDGGLSDLITVRAGGSRLPDRSAVTDPADLWFAMEGRLVYRNAVRHMASASRRALAHAGWSVDDVDVFIAHQANMRILETVADEVGIARERVFANVAEVGNTVAASVPLALHDAVRANVLRPGHRVLLVAFGGGLTWGATTLVWPTVVGPSADADTEKRQS